VRRRTVKEEWLKECVEQHERCKGERDKVPRLRLWDELDYGAGAGTQGAYVILWVWLTLESFSLAVEYDSGL
jgi:hypothetical protein